MQWLACMHTLDPTISVSPYCVLLKADVMWCMSTEVRKSVVSINFPHAILGPEMAAPILWAPGIFGLFLQENPSAHKIPLWGGGGFFLRGGGSANYIFMGVGIFPMRGSCGRVKWNHLSFSAFCSLFCSHSCQFESNLYQEANFGLVALPLVFHALRWGDFR